MNDFVVIFDMDGVIVNSEPIHQDCEREIFQKMHISLTQEEHDRFMGVSGFDMWNQLINEFNLNESAKNLEIIQNNCFINKLKKSRPFPIIKGVRELISLLTEKEVLLMVASSSSHKIVNNVLTLSGLEKYFKYIINGSGRIKSKPAPDIFLKAAREGEVNPAECIVIEDSENGIKAAKHAGMAVIGLLNGTNSLESVNKADLIVDNLSDITIETFRNLIKLL